MRKRKGSVEDESDSTASEMEVDGEEKMEQTEESDVDESEDELDDAARKRVHRANNENPFLDSFYGLSSEDPAERSQAAQTMLHQCLVGPSANTKDASYALRRLLNGLCSGRAAARQGNASALSSFLKIAFQLEQIESIQIEMDGENPSSKSALSFVRNRLLSATDPSQIPGQKKGSEERDYQFGRLFGILAIMRSNILMPNDDMDLSDVESVATSLLSDLAELFWLKKWMREPAAHGVTTMLKMLYEGTSKDLCQKVLDHAISHVVVPKILTKGIDGKEFEGDEKRLLESYCAEQIGIVCFIQSRSGSLLEKLPHPLNRPVLSVETMPLISAAIAETSSVVQPRTHFVWDSMWCFLFQTTEHHTSKNRPKRQKLMSKCLIGDDSAIDIIESMIESVVMRKLLGIGADSGSPATKATHERRALALCIVKNLSGVPFLSSLEGPIQLVVDDDAMESVILAPPLIRRLFMDVICAGKQNTSHLLKPLALEVLSSMTVAIKEEAGNSGNPFGRQLACVRALMRVDVRFDTKTKTSTMTDLIGLGDVVSDESEEKMLEFIEKYIAFVEKGFLEKCKNSDESTTTDAVGYVEALYTATKRIIRMETENANNVATLQEFKDSIVRRVLSFFMAAAFFDCSGSVDVESKSGKKKKNKKKASARSQILESATIAKGTSIDFSIRATISARFFSLLSDYVHHETHQRVEGRLEKDSIALSFLEKICDDWNTLEASGARRFSLADGADTEKSQTDMTSILRELQKKTDGLASAMAKEVDDALVESKVRYCRGVTVLVYSLHLHRLSCGKSDSEIDNDDPDADEEDDEEEICNAIEGLKDVTVDFLDGNIAETNPLLGLTELCANILSSPLGSGEIGRGCSPKLLREGIKYAWLGGLRLSSGLSTDDRSLLNADVVDTLLEAIGASEPKDGDAEEEDEEEDSGGDDNDESSSDDDNGDDSDDENVFTKAATLLEDTEHMDVDPKNGTQKSADEEESDVELDHDKLKSVLEEDSDADVDSDILEHHEGADEALAKLIKLKQDARKAGQLAREKIEIAHQLRCTYLLELLFGRSDAWSSLFSSDVIFRMLLPMLKHRKKIEKMLEKVKEGNSKSGFGEKKALLDRISSLLKGKICKLRFSSKSIQSTTDVEAARLAVENILSEARRTTEKEHVACCSSAIIFVMRSQGSFDDSVTVGSSLVQAVEEWSTKRTSRLNSSMFDDMISQIPSLAQAILVAPLASASLEARSPFLKQEAFRLLASLFVSMPKDNTMEDEKQAIAKQKLSQGTIMTSFSKALVDEDMKKTKRLRTVLKSLDKFISYLTVCSTEEIKLLESIKATLHELAESESHAVKSTCTKLVEEIDSKIGDLQTETEESNEVMQNDPGSGSKKAKKKKKKKKR